MGVCRVIENQVESGCIDLPRDLARILATKDGREDLADKIRVGQGHELVAILSLIIGRRDLIDDDVIEAFAEALFDSDVGAAFRFDYLPKRIRITVQPPLNSASGRA